MCWEKILNLEKPNVIPIYIFQLLFTIVTLPSNKILDANCKLLYSSVSIIWLHSVQILPGNKIKLMTFQRA